LKNQTLRERKVGYGRKLYNANGSTIWNIDNDASQLESSNLSLLTFKVEWRKLKIGGYLGEVLEEVLDCVATTWKRSLVVGLWLILSDYWYRHWIGNVVEVFGR
jgi:hypothetical protein